MMKVDAKMYLLTYLAAGHRGRPTIGILCRLSASLKVVTLKFALRVGVDLHVC